METTTNDIWIDEYVIEKQGMPGHYVARLAIRFHPDTFAHARGICYAFLKARYANCVVSGSSGSPNGDQITVWFWSSGAIV